MRIVIALGGNALLRRGEPMTAAIQRENVRTAAEAIAPVTAAHEVVLSHGNGPQVGLLALQAAAAVTSIGTQENTTFPLDVLGAETEGMIGYLIEQELGNLLPEDQPMATLLTMVEVAADDPAFTRPTKFVGPLYTRAEADVLQKVHGWSFREDGDSWRRVVPSPEPRRIFEIRPIRWLLDKGTVVICTGGGGIPTMFTPDGKRILTGVEGVIDKDLASALLAQETEADLLIMATDVEGVYTEWGTPDAQHITSASPDAISAGDFPSGSMGPKVEAACRFARTPGKRAVIGALTDISAMVAGRGGTQIYTGALYRTTADTTNEEYFHV
ncbi:carbamate kinase [Methanogenium organophilum]|uniref:Carbamate kinase n=1 Tax=Methanogenium organophilum TaxID=2199 RepID=A0A9X9S6K4_METOG|nr:carbamate kinase [Methanogenium organophilum]WAI02355.1 carbamate kinase [Methanogenium organophilum]